MFNLEYQQWAGSGKERNWKRWRGPFEKATQAVSAQEAEQKMWPNDSFRIVETKP